MEEDSGTDIVPFSLLGGSQDLRNHPQPCKPFFNIFDTNVFIWMKLKRLFAIGFGNLVSSSTGVNVEVGVKCCSFACSGS